MTALQKMLFRCLRYAQKLLLLSQNMISMAAFDVVHHNACGLEMRINNSGAHKLKSTFFEILADAVGEGRRRLNI
jgi:hypothetical protein